MAVLLLLIGVGVSMNCAGIVTMKYVNYKDNRTSNTNEEPGDNENRNTDYNSKLTQMINIKCQIIHIKHKTALI